MRKNPAMGTLILLALLAALAGCEAGTSAALETSGESESMQPAQPENPDDGEVAPGSVRFGLALLKQEAVPQRARVLLSPTGVYSALLLAWNGAAGDTRTAMSGVLGLDEDQPQDAVNDGWNSLERALVEATPGRDVRIAKSLWGRQDLRFVPAWQRRLRDSFGIEPRAIDFSAPGAANTINAWVESSTHGMVTRIVPDPVPSNVALYLLSAVTFKGTWSEPFDPALTQSRDFHPATGPVESVPMMARSGQWSYIADGEVQAVRLPYGDGTLTMVLVLPGAGGLDPWLERLDATGWESLLASMSQSEGLVVLPRLSFGEEAKLRTSLSNLGMAVALGEEADFSALATKPVAISDVLHSTYLELDETGTTAAAATAVEMVDVAIPAETPTPFSFIADRPFFLAIRDERVNELLFVGVIRSLH